MSGLQLAEAVRMLRQELLSSRAEGEGADLQFELGEITVELKAVISKVGNGKLGWKIIEVGGSVESEATQTITLTLTPLGRDAATGLYEPAPRIAGHLAQDGDAGERASQQGSAPAGAASTTAGRVDDDGPVDE